MEGCLTPEEVDALLDGKLPPAELARAEAHVDVCASCRIVVGNIAQDESPSIASAETAVERPVAKPRTSGAMPEHIGRYEVVRKIGAGGMGIVLLAEDSDLKRKVVIKLLRKEIVDDGRERLMREAQAMAKLSHANVVPIFDVGVHEGQVFIAMEYLDGGDLAAWLQTRRERAEILTVFLAAGRGLAAAHRAGLVHRDFKPHNVLLGKSGEVKVTDFGLARNELTESGTRRLDRARPRVSTAGNDLFVASLLDSPLTESGTVVGTPAYMAPEQILAQFVDARTDQFSFCVALHEALYGMRPFAGRDSKELFEATLAGELAPVPSDRKVPTRLRDAVRRGLSVEPADRFPTMDALLAELAPTRRRAPWIAGGAAAAAIGGVITVAVISHQPAGNTCTGFEGRLAGAWDAAVAKQMKEKFAAAGVEKSFPPIAEALDRYAKSWVDVRVDACRATHTRGDQTEEGLARRFACLDARKVELAALTARMSDDPAKTYAGGARVASMLTAPTTCSGTNALAFPEAIPDSAKELQKELAELGIRLQFNAVDRERVKAVVEKADAQPYIPTRVEAHIFAASATQGDNAAAEAELRTAIQIAEVGSYDLGRATATIRLAEVLVNMGNLADAKNAVEAANATLKRIGGNPILDATLLAARASLARAEGKPDEALAIYEQALAAFERASGPDSIEVAEVLVSMSGIYNGLGRDADEARVLKRAEEIFARLSPNKSVADVVQLMNEQSVADDAGDTRRALEIALRTLGLMQTQKQEVPEVMVATQYGAVGVYHWELRELPAARDAFLEAANRFEKLPGQEHQVSAMLDYAGRCVRDIGNHDEAVALFRRSKAASDTNLDARRDLGTELAEHGTPDEAIAELEWVVPRLEQNKHAGLGATRLAFAEALWRRAGKGDRERARSLGELALVGASEKLRPRVEKWLDEHKLTGP